MFLIWIRLFFQLVKINPTFLAKPAREWSNDDSFIKIGNIVKSLKVINDAGERAVKMGADYSETLVKDDAQRQALLQGVELHRKTFQKPTKKELQKDAKQCLNK